MVKRATAHRAPWEPADREGCFVKESAGTLLYRRKDDQLEVLLIHHSGGYNRNAPWGIPKGTIEPGESVEQAARRETIEETGVTAGDLVPLGSIQYRRSRKRVYGFAGPAPADAAPRCASWEIDCAEFLPMDEARRRIHVDQLPFLERLEKLLQPGQGESLPA